MSAHAVAVPIIVPIPPPIPGPPPGPIPAPDAVSLPGGAVATFYTARSLPRSRARRLRHVCKAALPLFQRAINARQLSVEGVVQLTDPTALGAAVDLTASELAQMHAVNDAGALAYLRCWTLDRPLPRTADELHALPADVYAVLSARAGRLLATAGDTPRG